MSTGTTVSNEIVLAERVARKHCPIDWPQGQRCLSCHEQIPCRAHRWARDVLLSAGRTRFEISALDMRTGPLVVIILWDRPDAGLLAQARSTALMQSPPEDR